jgi:putative flippase GtrA
LNPNLKHTRLVRQFISYVGVGGTAFAVDFGCLFVLTSLAGMHYLVSATLAFLLGLATNYLLCILWVFDYRRMSNRLHEFTVFGAIGIAGLILNNITLYLLTDLVGIHYLVSKAIAAAFILVFNFSLRRWMLFSPTLETPDPIPNQKNST